MPEDTRHKPVALAVIEGCQRGDIHAQEALYGHFGRLVMATCLRYASNSADAEDIFQESFIAIFEQIGSLKHPERIVSWIYRIVISKVIRYYRKRAQVVEVTEWNIHNNSPAYQEHEIIQALSAEELLALVQQLPDGYRLVFNLHVMEGYSHGEIGRMLGIREATSRSQLHKAKCWLQKTIVEKFGIHSYEK
ncbi:MAG: sigma-70 family RNA polymerase sigma factor [Phaeodactylibacter sp.]|nr:sigma-70 family RNA polymerase sigma factor [Phaeodactylibacter sp.]